MQLATPCVFQNIDVRAPSGTLAGTAQMSTFASTTGAVVVETCCVGLGPVWVTVTCGALGTGKPTWYPRHVHKPSKKFAGTTYERKFVAHGLVLHKFATSPVGFWPVNVFEP